MRVSVVIPARNESATVARVVRAVAGSAAEVIVVDDGSTDDTAGVAAAAGARVVSQPPLGKGLAMRAGLDAAAGDVVVFVDADVDAAGFSYGFVRRLVEPFADERVVLVKASYQRAGEGGRVNELVARPLLDRLFPALSFVAQPLGGEYAGRRAVLDALAFEPGYGVDIGLLLDVAARHGAGSIAQVDLGVRTHRNRPLAELAPMARAVMDVVLDRAGVVAPASRRLGLA